MRWCNRGDGFEPDSTEDKECWRQKKKGWFISFGAEYLREREISESVWKIKS